MSKIRYVAAAALLAVILWYDIAVKGQGVAESVVPLVSFLVVSVLGRILVRRVPETAKVVLWIAVLIACAAINLLQLYIHDKWFEWFAFGVTIGALLVMFTDPAKEETHARTMR